MPRPKRAPSRECIKRGRYDSPRRSTLSPRRRRYSPRQKIPEPRSPTPSTPRERSPRNSADSDMIKTLQGGDILLDKTQIKSHYPLRHPNFQLQSTRKLILSADATLEELAENGDKPYSLPERESSPTIIVESNKPISKVVRRDVSTFRSRKARESKDSAEGWTTDQIEQWHCSARCQVPLAENSKFDLRELISFITDRLLEVSHATAVRPKPKLISKAIASEGEVIFQMVTRTAASLLLDVQGLMFRGVTISMSRLPLPANIHLRSEPIDLSAVRLSNLLPEGQSDMHVEIHQFQGAGLVSSTATKGASSITTVKDESDDVNSDDCPALTIVGLPSNSEFPDEYVYQLLAQFGTPTGLYFLRDATTGHRTSGFFSYKESDVANQRAVNALNGMYCAGQLLRLLILGNRRRRSDEPATNEWLHNTISFRIYKNPKIAKQIQESRAIAEIPTRVVQLLNTVRTEDLLNSDVYAEIKRELLEDARQYGAVDRLVIPRPNEHGDTGVGKVFLYFVDLKSARSYQHNTNGRQFDESTICASFYPEDAFLKGEYVLTSISTNSASMSLI